MEIDIGIPEKKRKEIANGLNLLLADTFTLYFKTHKFHWNVTGPMFQTLHSMFETQYNELWIAIDEIAERVRSLGEFAKGSYEEYQSITTIPSSPLDPKAEDMIRDLLLGHEAVARTARKVFPACEEASDEATLDMLTQRIQTHEKTAWMLRSLLQ